MLRLLVLATALILQLACGNSAPAPTPQSNSASSGQSHDGWKEYEDDWFRILYPEGSDVGGATGRDGKQNPTFPTLAAVPRTAGAGVFGAFTLQFDTKTRGMLLRDAIQSQIKSHIDPRGALLTPPREVKVGNGKCLSAIASWPFEHCPKDQGSCYSASILTLCDDSAGRRYSADCLLSRGNKPNSLSPQAQQEAAVYERILRSLEFKKS